MKKLILSQETLRNLTEDELRHVAGVGTTHTCASLCNGCTTTPPITPACP